MTLRYQSTGLKSTVQINYKCEIVMKISEKYSLMFHFYNYGMLINGIG